MKITATNLFVLKGHMGGASTASARVKPTDASHLRRCIKAGLVTVSGAQLVLTDTGKEAVA